MRRQLDRLSDNMTFRSIPSFPALNVWSNADGLLVTAEVPGVELEDLDIAIVDKTLTLSGKRELVDLPEDARYHRRERGSGQFSRSIELPYRIEADHVQATFDRGVLTIRLPRAEDEKPRRIKVQTGAGDGNGSHDRSNES
ncbi:MAG: Hsp20/alpha crystallin family protein [Anaerolineales bacterium]|nr:Hsp20/alpha crystallin family protein [Anaerolineales bacterium]MCB8986584.1 Hsp20/alpha crystallin family protein [Ardenticatenaceae bacterium]